MVFRTQDDKRRRTSRTKKKSAPITGHTTRALCVPLYAPTSSCFSLSPQRRPRHRNLRYWSTLVEGPIQGSRERPTQYRANKTKRLVARDERVEPETALHSATSTSYGRLVLRRILTKKSRCRVSSICVEITAKIRLRVIRRQKMTKCYRVVCGIREHASHVLTLSFVSTRLTRSFVHHPL